MRRLLTSLGEALIDFLPQGDGDALFRARPGGAPFNVAVGMARLDGPGAFAGKISRDLFGRQLLAYAEREGVDTRFMVPSAAPCTLAFVAMEEGEPAYAFYDQAAADTLLLADEVPAALFAETAILHYGSISLLRGSTPAAVLATARRLQDDALLSFDPNLRPGLVHDAQAYRALLAELFAFAHVVKLSAADLTWLAPGRPPADVARELAQGGATLVVVTLGGAGVLAVRGAEQWQVPPYPVAVMDTVGAGDAFSAGLLVGLAERGVLSRAALAALPPDEIQATLQFAQAVAAITCTRAGADPPRRAEVATFLAQHEETPRR